MVLQVHYLCEDGAFKNNFSEIGGYIMDELTKLQNDYLFFKDMLKSLERKKKKTPGTGFAKMKCRKRLQN